jgi:hypothetical protein
MKTKQLKAVVAGDVTVDWLEWPVAASNEATSATCSSNWQLHDGIRLTARPGGALLLASLLRGAGIATVAAPEILDLEGVPATDVLHYHVRLARFAVSA